MSMMKIFGDAQKFPNLKALSPVDRKSAFLILRETGMSDDAIAGLYAVSLRAVHCVLAQRPFSLEREQRASDRQTKQEMPFAFEKQGERHFSVLQVLIEKRCRISVVRLAATLDLSESEVKTSLSKLISEGLIVKADRAPGRQPDRYILTEKGRDWSLKNILPVDVEIVPTPSKKPVLKLVQHARSAPMIRVLAAIADSGARGMSQPEMFMKMHLHKDTVAHHFKSLLKRGWIECLRASKGQTPALYGVTLPGLEALEEAI